MADPNGSTPPKGGESASPEDRTWPTVPFSKPPPAIPEELTRPVDTPASLKAARAKKEGGLGGIARAWGTALDFVFTILAGGVLGFLADKYYFAGGSKGVLIGLASGFVIAFIRIVRSTLAQERAEAKARTKKSG